MGHGAKKFYRIAHMSTYRHGTAPSRQRNETRRVQPSRTWMWQRKWKWSWSWSWTWQFKIMNRTRQPQEQGDHARSKVQALAICSILRLALGQAPCSWPQRLVPRCCSKQAASPVPATFPLPFPFSSLAAGAAACLQLNFKYSLFGVELHSSCM